MADGVGRMIFVNLAVASAAKTRAFFEGLGFGFNEQFRSEDTECMVISDVAYAMFLEPTRFKDFTKKQLVDPRTHTEVLVALSCDSREAVDEIVGKALASGGAPAMPAQDLGFMYG